MDGTAGAVLEYEWDVISVESRDRIDRGRDQPSSHSGRIRHFPDFLSHFYRVLRVVRICALRDRTFCFGSFARAGARAAIAHLPGEPDGLPSLGPDLRNHSGVDVGREPVEHRRGPQCKRSAQQFCRFKRDDTSRSDREPLLTFHCPDSFHCERHRAR